MNLSLVLARVGYDQNNPTHYFQVSSDSSEWVIAAFCTSGAASVFVQKHPFILEKDNIGLYQYDYLSWLDIILLDFNNYTPPTDVPC